VLRFPADLGIQEWMVASAKRPGVSQQAKPIQFLNTETYVLGRYTWDEVTVVLNDPIGPSASQAVMEWQRLHTESLTGRQGYAAGYKRDVELCMLDPTGVVVQLWIFKNCFLTKLDFGDLSYSQDDLAQVTITLRPDYCILAY
jgi:hypothetical protein